MDVVLGVGIITFWGGILLGAFVKEAKNTGTSAWKWKNILLIAGSVSIGQFLREQRP
jgi:hypothetical protein